MVSGFTFMRNAEKLHYPIEASIRSLLPLVDELIIALGSGDPDDHTRQIIEAIASEKISVYDRTWNSCSFYRSKIFAEETNFALSKCSGDICIYLQGDEVIHEKDYPVIKQAINDLNNRKEIDGLLFQYYHFWGDFNHHLPFHGWYNKEIRIIKNNLKIYSYKDAQSFRKGENKKLQVLSIPAHIYHYGWVRPARLMQNKKVAHEGIHHGESFAQSIFAKQGPSFDYGPLGRLPIFLESHPNVMSQWIKNMDWQEELNLLSSASISRPLYKHERLKYRALTWIENKLLGGNRIFDYQNWIVKK